MAKRYYQTKKDRMDESRGMKRSEKKKRSARMYSDREYYAGREDRDRREYEDSRMIMEDRRAVANLPQNVIMREYPKPGRYTPSRISDTIVGIDIQMDEDASMTKRELYPEKY